MVFKTVRKFNSKYCVLVALDVKNAFNPASHELIIEKLEDRVVSQYLVNIICSYLSNRKIQIEKGEIVNAKAGVPQESTLGSIL